MPETKTDFVLPESFLEAARAAAENPLYFASKRGGLIRLPFVGGGAEGDGTGTEGGTSSEGEGDSGEGGQTEEQNSGGQSGEDDDEGDEDETSGVPDNIKAILKKNRQEARDARRALEKANEELAAARKTAKEYEDRDKSALEKAEDRAKQAEERAAKLEDDNKALALRTAFNSNSDYTWVDADDAFEMARRNFGLADLEIRDGTVDKKKLKAILKTMAEDKPYLVSKGSGEGDGKGGKGASGGSFNSGKGGAKSKNEAAIARRYPAMQGRRKVD